VDVLGGSLVTVTGWTSFQEHTALRVDNSDAEVFNSILSYYSYNSQDGYGVQTVNNGALTVCHSNVWSPWGTTYSNPPGDQTGLCGNISRDPRFEDIYVDLLSPASNSPCRDAGDDGNAAYYDCTTVAAGTLRTLFLDIGCATEVRVSDWIEYDNDGTLRRISAVDPNTGEATFAPALSAPSQPGTLVQDYGPGDLYLHPRICGANVDMGAFEYCAQFHNDECLPESHSDYAEWIALGKPNCWCGHYASPPRECQCQGDADGKAQGSEKTGFYYVGPNDLNALISCWLLKEPPHGPGIALIPNGICVDFDHQIGGGSKTGFYRVGPSDLNILVGNWLVKEPPHGPGVPADCVE